jgi:hypothetical protein
MRLHNQIASDVEQKHEPLQTAFFWLSAFYFVYCARPEDWIPGLTYIPLAKITAVCGVIALIFRTGKPKRSIRNLPLEGHLLIGLVCFLVLTSLFSPVWRGGALNNSLGFAKVAVAWVATFLVITSLKRLERIIFVQTASVAAIAVVSLVTGRASARLGGVLRGIYDNSNDLAFAIVLSLPFCFVFLLRGRGLVRKLGWALIILIMIVAVFRTASRGGFIELAITTSVCLWHFGVKGKRPQLVLVSFAIGAVLLLGLGGMVKKRFVAISGVTNSVFDENAYGSYRERRQLMISSVKTIARYPFFGIGVQNFVTYSGIWKEVHNCYLQIGAEGGIPALILYLLFFRCGFSNLKRLRRLDLNSDVELFVGALHGSLIGFIVGGFFAPEAYQFFSFLVVAETSVMWAIVWEQDITPTLRKPPLTRLSIYNDSSALLVHPRSDNELSASGAARRGSNLRETFGKQRPNLPTPPPSRYHPATPTRMVSSAHSHLDKPPRWNTTESAFRAKET